MTSNNFHLTERPPGRHRRLGVVAVITRAERFLVIRRSQFVRAPGAFCFPGGGVEADETPPVALQRELREELSVKATIVRHLWTNQTPSGVELGWWRAELGSSSDLRANPAEVESIHWLSADELRRLPQVLATNLDFLDALERREFCLD